MEKTPLRDRYTFTDFLYYTSLLAIPAFTAFYAISIQSTGWSIFYIAMCIAAAVVTVRFYCSHCPHYTRESRTVRCMFMWGIPKLFAPRPGPLNLLDKTVALLAPTILVVFPLHWLLLQPGLMVIFILSLGVFLFTVRKNECRRCIYFDCPVNNVPEDRKFHDTAT